LGQKRSLIADTLNLAPSTVQYTIDKSTLRNKGNTLTRKGRPKKYTNRDRRQIVNFVRINPKSTYEDIRQNLHIYLSRDTLGRILDSVGIKNWRAKGRPTLEPEDAKLQYNWALVYCEWLTEWQWIIFSDECSVQRGKGGQREWVFPLPSQKWLLKMVQTYRKSTDISIMVWGAIWYGGRSDLVIMERHEESKGGGYSANSYLKVLQEQMPKCYKPGRVFMQDNTSIHTAKKITKWCEDHAILLLDWAPYSPDMNLIEHVWAKMRNG
jgi:DDE superfamily endonuclease/Transposase